MNIGIQNSLDWITATYKMPPNSLYSDVPLPQGDLWKVERLEPSRGFYYEQAVLANGARLHMPKDFMRHGFKLDVGGEALRLSRIDDQKDRDMLAAIFGQAKLTRLDYALDIFDNGLSVKDFIDAWYTGQVECVAKKARYIRDISDSLGGTSLYIGSPSSDRMCRIYDKIAESKTEDYNHLFEAWTRIELQTRRERALAMAQDILRYDVEIGGQAHLTEYVSFPTIGAFWTATNGRAYKIDTQEVKKNKQHGANGC